jgi:ATP/maltotriose-dependent transcriptional regulator MalT
MEAIRDEAAAAGARSVHGRALTALSDVTLLRDADLPRARELANLALDVLPEDDAPGRFDALSLLSQMAHWAGDLSEVERYVRRALEIAETEGRKDLEAEATQKLATIYLARLDLDEAEVFVRHACELAEVSGSIAARAQAVSSRAALLSLRGELEDAEENFEEARALFEEAGAAWPLARAVLGQAWVAWERGDLARAEKLFRESIRILKPLEDRGALCESQRSLAQLLVAQGKLDEAERLALEARKTVGPHDETSRATTRMALALVRAAQGRDEEAEHLLTEALEIVERTDFNSVKIEVATALANFLRDRGREDEALEVERRVSHLGPLAWSKWLQETALRVASAA